MQPFSYQRPDSPDAAAQAVRTSSTQPGTPAAAMPAQFIAGGTNMTDYMGLDVVRPSVLVDVSRLPADRYGRIEADGQRLRLGALVRMAQAEDHEEIRGRYPVIRETLLLAASRQ